MLKHGGLLLHVEIEYSLSLLPPLHDILDKLIEALFDSFGLVLLVK